MAKGRSGNRVALLHCSAHAGSLAAALREGALRAARSRACLGTFRASEE